MLKKKMAAYFVHGHKCVIIVIPPPHHHRPCLGNVTWDILVKNILPMGSANSNICGVPSEIPRKKCHMRKADKRTYRARDVERDGGRFGSLYAACLQNDNSVVLPLLRLRGPWKWWRAVRGIIAYIHAELTVIAPIPSSPLTNARIVEGCAQPRENNIAHLLSFEANL